MKKLIFDTDNEPLSAITHLAGVLLSIVGLVLLVVFASREGNPSAVVGFSIFGTSLILLYLASTLYHFAPITSKFRSVMKKIDHSMIYVLIAGTYTPLCIVALKGGWGWSLFGTIWGLAILGIVWKAVGKMNRVVSIIFYLVMGWLEVIALIPLKSTISSTGLFWLFAGGVFYTLGTAIFALEHFTRKRKWFSLHDLWHIFVMLGSASHFWLIYRYIL